MAWLEPWHRRSPLGALATGDLVPTQLARRPLIDEGSGGNIGVLTGVYRLFRRVKAGEVYADEELNAFLAQRGVLGRLFARCFG